jgi:hypothetical protein
MAQATNLPSRFDNLSNEALADAIGHADAVLKGAEAECAALKDEFKRRNLREVAGGTFTVRASAQFNTRLDTKGVRDFLGEAASRFEITTASIVIRIRAITQLATAA